MFPEIGFKMQTAGNILVNEKPVKSNYKLNLWTQYPSYWLIRQVILEVVPQEMPLNIVYEDDDIILVNKQPNLVVHPGFEILTEHCLTALPGIKRYAGI